MIRVPSLLASTAVLALLLAPSAGVARQVGAAGAVNPAATGTPPGAGARTLELGASVIHRERIRTTAGGSLQVIFIDKTTLNVGPNSDIVIDEFVYDPNTGVGRMAATMAKGVMRFVGGNVSHTGGADIKTPAATLGIRGGVATITHSAQEGTRAISHFGTLTVTTSVASEVIRRPGFGITVPSNIVPPPPPQRASVAEINAVNQQLTSAPGQSGGAKRKPTNEAAANSGVARANERVTTANMEGQSQVVASTQAVRPITIQSDTRDLQQEAAATAPPPPATDSVPPSDPGPFDFFFGFAGGHVTTTNRNTGTRLQTPQPVTGSNVLFLDGTQRRVQQNFFVQNEGNIVENGFEDGSYQAGTIIADDAASSDYGDGRNFSARQPTEGPLSEVNAALVTREVVTTRSASLSEARSSFPGVTFCECEYSRWGFWSAETDRVGPNGQPYTDRIPQGVWVAGVIPDAAQVPTSGTATYSGHAIASINNNGSTYLAAGNMTNAVNFATRVGDMTISGLDTRTYKGQVDLISGSAYFLGTLNTTAGTSATANVIGSFYQGAGGPVQEMGGQLSITGGTNYTGAGIFQGRAN